MSLSASELEGAQARGLLADSSGGQQLFESSAAAAREAAPPVANVTAPAVANAAFSPAGPPADANFGVSAEAFIRFLGDNGVTVPDTQASEQHAVNSFRSADGGFSLESLTLEQRAALASQIENRMAGGGLTWEQATQAEVELLVVGRAAAHHQAQSEQFTAQLGALLDQASGSIKGAFAQFDPKLAQDLDRGVKAANFAVALIDALHGKGGADKEAVNNGLSLVSSGLFGQEAAQYARVVIGLKQFGDGLKGLDGKNPVGSGLDAAAGIATVFSTGLFGQELAKTASEAATYIGAARSAANFVARPTSASGLNLLAFGAGMLFRSEGGQIASNALSLAGSIASASSAVPGTFAASVLGPVGIVLSGLTLIGSVVNALKDKTLKITNKVDVSGDGANDRVTFRTKKDDWYYEVTNGAQTLPFQAVGYRLVAETAPAGAGRLVMGSPRSGGSYVEYVGADGALRRLNVDAQPDYEGGSDVPGVTLRTGRANFEALQVTRDSQGTLWVAPPKAGQFARVANPAAPPLVTGYRLEIDARYQPINGAPSLEEGAKSASLAISREQYDQLMARFGSGQGVLMGSDARAEALRPYLSGSVTFKQEKKNEGFSYYRDLNGDSVLDRITNYVRIPKETNGDDSMRFEMLDRSGRVWLEYATDKNGAISTDSRAARSVAGGAVMKLGDREVFGRFNVRNYVDMLAGVDKTRPRDVGSGGMGQYLSKASEIGTGLAPNGQLTSGQYIVSADRRFALVMQGDGNAVVYQRHADTGELREARWSSGTAGSGADRIVLQGDGNLVVYAGANAVWNSKTRDGSSLRLQDDGNLVLSRGDGAVAWHAHSLGAEEASLGSLIRSYGPVQPQGAPPAPVAPPAQLPQAQQSAPAVQPVPPGLAVVGSALGTGRLGANQAVVSPNGRYVTVFQGDGNLVAYDMLGGMKALWSSGTQGRGAGGFAAMQGDGNLVVYDAGGRALWASGTEGRGVDRGFSLAMQDDGNLVVYDSQGSKALWSTLTGRIDRAAGAPAPVAAAAAPAGPPRIETDENGSAFIRWSPGVQTSVRVMEDADTGQIVVQENRFRSSGRSWTATRGADGAMTLQM